MFGIGRNKAPEPGQKDWERGVLEKLAYAAVTEQRRSRRWGIFFKSLIFVYLFLLLFIGMDRDQKLALADKDGFTAVIEVEGVIAPGADASAENIIEGLQAAFDNKNTKGVILQINSPGGSPVQAGYINDEIYRLKEERPDLPVYAVVTDICASGAYYIAVAADQIFADKASLVGSIGVRMDGFGFTEAMDKLGIERRLLTAGEHKGMLDPFSPVNKEEETHVKSLLDEIHTQFIDVVKKGRGERLTAEEDIFNGLIWTGTRSVELGLVDGINSTARVAADIIGNDNLRDFTPKEDFMKELSKHLGGEVRSWINEFSMSFR